MRSWIPRCTSLILVCIGFGLPAQTLDHPSNPLAPQPRYELKLTPGEYSIIHAAATSGVGMYGGDAEYKLRLTKERLSPPSATTQPAEQLVWTMTIANPRLLDVLRVWMAEKTAELLGVVDFEKLDDETKLALRAVQSVNAKIQQAQANPVWDTITLTGTVIDNDGALYLQTESGKLELAGAKLAELRAWKGKGIVATGVVKVKGQFEAARFIDRKENTLELFVMSHCPFAQRAEAAILQYIRGHPPGKDSGDHGCEKEFTRQRDHPPENPPRIEIHYIFYNRPGPDGQPVYTAMHGEDEVRENLAQMILRDDYPNVFADYLLRRAKSDAPWPQLVHEVGLPPEAADAISRRVSTERQALIEREYAYVAGERQVLDGSPQFAWESQQIADLRTVPALREFDLNQDEKCGR